MSIRLHIKDIAQSLFAHRFQSHVKQLCHSHSTIGIIICIFFFSLKRKPCRQIKCLGEAVGFLSFYFSLYEILFFFFYLLSTKVIKAGRYSTVNSGLGSSLINILSSPAASLFRT